VARHARHTNAPNPDSPAGDDQFLEKMNLELAGWSDPLARLRQALDRDELQLYCQPILSLQPKGGFTMAEVLVRLREEEKLMLPPGEFLPVFEHYGMMPELDRWVVRHVVRWLAGAPPGGFQGFSVNTSVQTIGDAEFPAFVAGELRAKKVPPASLIFEVEESSVLARMGSAAQFAAAMKRAGCRVAIDGFGQRSVSFAPLKTLRIDFIKVDGSIVRNLLRSAVAEQKLKAMVRVGEAIRIGVIAECVEEAAILARLRELGVGFAQGFGIAQPAPIGRRPAPR
jgi:EAL domain-containing protein (putative c-di-GMP-specific phosphodiesterase class I)